MDEGGLSEAVMFSVAKSHEDPAHIFRFFDLPRELRDMIYEQPILMQHWHTRTPMLDDHCLYTKGKKLDTSLLLVSRQFRNEYTERCLDQQTLSLRDCFDFSDAIGLMTVLDSLMCWVLDICLAEYAAGLVASRELESYLGNCAHWYYGLRTVNLRLYLNHQSDLGDCAPDIFDHLQSTFADIAFFEKIAKLEIYMTKPTRRHTTATWSRQLLARWRRGEPEAIILLGPALHTERSEWEDFEGFTFDAGCSGSSSHSSYSSSSGSWYDAEDAGDDQENDTDNDEDSDEESGENISLYEELLDQKGYESADESDNDVGDDIDSDDIVSNENTGRGAGDEHPHSNHANNTSSHFDFFKLPVLSASPIDIISSRIPHGTETAIIDTAAPAFTSRPPPQDYTHEMRFLRIICLGFLAVLIFIQVCGVSDMIFSSR